MDRRSLFDDPADGDPRSRPPQASTAPAPPAPDRRTGTLRAASFGVAIALVAFTMPLGLMGSIVPDLGASASGRTWVLSSMSVGLASALLVAGSLADDLGRRRIFLAGLVTFAVGSALGALAGSVALLSVARGVQGVGGAALLASSLSLVAHAYPVGPERAHATGIWGAMLGAGIAVGPIAGALIAELGDWHTAYAALAVIAALAVVPAARLLEESRAAERKPVDPLGAGLLALGLVAITTGIVQGNTSGWASTTVLAGLIGGVAVLGLFAAHELRSRAPLFDVRLLATPGFTAALAGSFALGFTVLSFMSYAMTFTQTTLGATAVAATFWGLPWAALSFLTSMRARVLGRFLSGRQQVGLGLLLCSAGLLTMLGLDGGSTPLRMVPGFAIMGVGTGMLNAALAQAAVGVVPPSRSGMGAGANNTARYLGAALGVALVVGLLHSGTEHRADRALGNVLEAELAVPLAREIADGGPRPSADGFAADATQLVDEIAKDSSTGAMNRVILVVALLAAGSAGLCFVLMAPARTKPVTEPDEARSAT